MLGAQWTWRKCGREHYLTPFDLVQVWLCRVFPFVCGIFGVYYYLFCLPASDTFVFGIFVGLAAPIALGVARLCLVGHYAAFTPHSKARVGESNSSNVTWNWIRLILRLLYGVGVFLFLHSFDPRIALLFIPGGLIAFLLSNLAATYCVRISLDVAPTCGVRNHNGIEPMSPIQ